MNNQVNLIYAALYRYTCLLNTTSGLPVFNSVYYEFPTYNTLMCHLYVFTSLSICSAIPCIHRDILRVYPWSDRLSKPRAARAWDAARIVRTYLDAAANKLTV